MQAAGRRSVLEGFSYRPVSPSRLELDLVRGSADTSCVTAGTPPRVYDVLVAAARELVAAVDASACVISRAIGDVLVMVAEHTLDGRTLQSGQGYLVPDYPATQAVLDRREPVALSRDDEGVDPAEAALLRELGFVSLLMLPLVLRGDVWGLVEIYRADDRPFEAADVAAANRVLAEATAPLQEL